MFTGANRLTLDGKFRLAVPTKYRDRLQGLCGGKLVLTIDTSKCLLIYAMPDWEDLARRVQKLPSLNVKAKALSRILLGHAQEVEMDQAGRVTVSPELREYAGIEHDAMLIGQVNRFELWDAKTWIDMRPTLLAEATSTGGTDSTPELDAFSL